ncbi:hypothetical protein TWF481_011863 [Arthrobotrys musiformis]|uniref:NB-ARC domain-containing protein n=1 Tax=Arthrobotrys musiformis TaxID=47236 RepID=A0AAV9VXS1_9PEZI
MLPTAERGIFQPDNDPAGQLKERLKKLIDQETAVVGALNLDATIDVLTQTTLTGEVSRNMDLKINGIIDSLGKIFEQLGVDQGAAPVKIKAINFAIPLRMPFPRNNAFTGREGELGAIDKCFTASASGDIDAPVVCALIGTGGMGKTQVALEYAYQHSDYLTSVFWISATTEDAVRTSFVDVMQQIVEEQAKITWPESAPDYEALSARLGIPDLIDSHGIVSSNPRVANDIQSALFRWLQLPDNRKWLLIFDNADDLEAFSVQDYFPKHGGGMILVTSRRPEFSLCCAGHVDLDGLDGESAVKLLLRLARSPDTAEDKDGATAVVEKLGFMPLAISHAGSFMYEANVSARDYLRYYEGAFMTVQSKKPKLGWNYRNDTAATAWELSFSEIQKQNEEAASLLLTCSYLSPNDISERMWEEEGGDLESLLRHKDRISLLASYSLIKKSHAGAFSVHPVVHTWARERLDDTARLQTMSTTIKLIGKALGRQELSRSSNQWNGREERRMAAHAEHIGKFLKPKFTEFLEQSGEDASKKEDTLDIIHKIAVIFSSQGKYDEATEWHEKVLAGREKILGEDHPKTLTTINNIAGGLSYQGKYNEAMQWYERAFAGREKVLGSDNLDTVTTINDMAWVVGTLGKYDEALQWYERALAGEKALGKDHPAILVAVNDMALVFSKKGEYDEAMQRHERALVGREKVLGKNHPDTLTTVNNMGGVFSNQGKYDQAINCYQRALDGRKKALGDDHPATLASISDMAEVFGHQGRYDEAMLWYERALAGQEKALGKDHPRTIATVNNIAGVLNKQGRYKEAIEWYQRALAGREKALGKDHPDTLATANEIALTVALDSQAGQAVQAIEEQQASQAKPKEPEPRSKRALNRFSKLFGGKGRSS